jgi:hypothetical protein
MRVRLPALLFACASALVVPAAAGAADVIGTGVQSAASGSTSAKIWIARRDRMKTAIDRLVKTTSEAAVFVH